MIAHLVTLLAGIAPLADASADAEKSAQTKAPKSAQVMVIPIREQIASPELYILRRGIKEAMEQNMDTVILDMETPGGELGTTFEMLKALEKFPGKTVTYVNREAISAGALISAGTDEIYFAPGSVIGAAAPVLSTGAEMDETMKDKIVSYLKARVRSASEGKGYRGEVISAMIDSTAVLKIGEEVIKPEGELLSLTAVEAVKTYGTPPQPLLGAGIADNVEQLITKLHGPGKHSVTRLETSWAERVAQYISMMAPVLMSLGMLALFIEFKTPGFGVFGITGLSLLAVVFLGHYVAGLSGQEPLVVFLLGVALVAAELFFFPGMMIPALVGAALMLGSLVWAMMDLWPGEPISFSSDLLLKPLSSVLLAVFLAVVMFIALFRFLPQGGKWGRLVLDTAVGGEPSGVHALGTNAPAQEVDTSLKGKRGTAVTPMMPSGQVEIDGRRYEARLDYGFAEAGTAVLVKDGSEFSLVVEVAV